MYLGIPTYLHVYVPIHFEIYYKIKKYYFCNNYIIMIENNK